MMPLTLSSVPTGKQPLAATVSEGEKEEQQPRLSLSVEGIWPTGQADAKDRVIARLSYLLPVSRGVTIPVTVTYANRDDLLGTQDHIFRGHVGISYKLGNGPSQSSTQ